MQKVTRHDLVPAGATFTSKDTDFVVADYARLPSDRRHRGRRRQPARRRHRRLVQAVLPDVAAGQAGRAGRDLPRAAAWCARRGRPARASSRLAGGVGSDAGVPTGRFAACGVAADHRGAGPPRSGSCRAGIDRRHRQPSIRRRASTGAVDRHAIAADIGRNRRPAGPARSRSACPARGGAWGRTVARPRGRSGAERSAAVGGSAPASRGCRSARPDR